jgi:hypothetical protein
MQKCNVIFTEVEHNEDLENYCVDIVKCGGVIKSRNINPDEEIGLVVFEVESRKEFLEKFKFTESFKFIE